MNNIKNLFLNDIMKFELHIDNMDDSINTKLIINFHKNLYNDLSRIMSDIKTNII